MRRSSPIINCAATGAAIYCLSTCLVLGSVFFAVDHVKRATNVLQNGDATLAGSLLGWDGHWYAQIASGGYSYSPSERSSVAFFPAFPLLGGATSRLLGISIESALLGVVHTSFLAALIVLAAYARARYEASAASDSAWSGLVLVVAALWPTGVFFRAAYTESLFLFLGVLALYAIERDWHPLTVSLIVGAATGTRPVGVALVPALLWYVSRRSHNWKQVICRVTLTLPVGTWGLLAYAAYLQIMFGDPMAFAKTQSYWVQRPGDSLDRLEAILTLKPLWSAYLPSSPAFWARHDPGANPLFSLVFANPLFFSASVLLVVLGAWKRWLNTCELLLCAGLLCIPYITMSYDNYMQSQGRFTAIVFPQYLVLGRLLANCRPAFTGIMCALSGALLCVYSVLLATSYRIY